MQSTTNSSKKRLKIALLFIMLIIIALIGRLLYLQLYKAEEYKKGALEQWTKSIDIKSKRGIIFDRKGKKLAVSMSSYTVWATPADVVFEKAKDTARSLAEILEMDEEIVYEQITKKQKDVKIKQWITNEQASEIRALRLGGIYVVEDNKRFYPYGTLASHIIGFTNIDNDGLEGIEKVYDKYLTGVPGKWIKTTDAANRQLPYDGEKIYDAEDGTSVVLTIDETIQHFAEKAAQQALLENKAKNISIVIMDPKTGEILAMTSKPDFDPNTPREPLDEDTKKQWEDLPTDKLTEKWFDMWRNFAVSDIYEPGSTFKIITAAAAIEENSSQPDSHFYCNGFVRDIPGGPLRCSRWYNPHGPQTFTQGMNNSCNVVFVNVARKLGKEKLYEYVKSFGFGEKTNIDLLGEQSGIIPRNTDVIKEIDLATMSYGHGIAVTPIQLVNALSAISNGGNLMKPRLVRELRDQEGKIIETFKPEIIRKVISEETSNTMLKMMETVVSEGSGTRSIIPGYRIGGKTGTAQKVIDRRYAPNVYIGSFVAVAPIEDPKIAMLVVVDEPSAGQHYGGTVAAPVAKVILEDIFNYLEIPPDLDDANKIQEHVIVPDIRNKAIEEVGRTLTDLGLKYTTEYLELTSDSKVLDQFPLPGIQVVKGSIIDLYFEIRPETITMPDLMGKTKEEAIKILDDLNIKYNLNGTGKVTNQIPQANEKINLEEVVTIDFQDTNR